MKKLALTLTALAALSGSAVAADLPARSYSKAPAPVVAAVSWTGCWISGGGGYGIAVHPVGNLALSWDHRAFDGAYASAFLARIKEILETRDWAAELG